MIANVLFVTSFNQELFNASGKAMCESYLSSGSIGRLWVASENMQGSDIPSGDNITVHPIEDIPGLKQWETANKDIIPKDLGGTAVCKCPGRPEPHSKKHKPGCPNAWFNRYASRWFRKVIAILDAARHGGAEIIVWMDSDSIFKKTVDDEIILEALKGKAVGYMKSKDRPVIESGLIIMHGGRGGFHLVESVYQRYMTGQFRKDERWDDGYQWQMVLQADPELKSNSIDMASKASGHADVLPHTVLGSYVEHHKGKHSRVMKLRK